MPVWIPESSQPGVTIFPPASITRAPQGGGRFAPTAAIRPPRITTVPRSIAGPETGRIRAFVMATTSPLAGTSRCAGAGTGTAGARLEMGTDDEGTEDDEGTDGPGTPKIPSWKSLRGTLPVSARSKTCAPSMKTRSAWAYALNGSPDQITTSAFFPGSSDPVTLSMPRAFAGLIDSHFTASARLIVMPASAPARLPF